MKAIVQDRYGGSDVLELRDIDQPVPKDNEVLTEVRAAGLHRGDWHIMTGLPYMIRLAVPTLGLRKPKVPVLGMDVAGTVAAVGKDVTQFGPGDEVFGWTDGSFAEYAVAPEDHLAAKPVTLSFEEAAVVPISGFAALQAVRDVGEVQAGQTVLVLGAAGAVGWFAVQLAKAFGAHVTGWPAPASWSWSARSVPTRSSTTPAPTSPTGPGSGTSSSTPGAAVPCRSCGGLSRPRGRWSSSAVRGADG